MITAPMNLRRVIEFPVVRIVIGIVAVVVLLVPAQVVAAGATTTSIRGVAVELYSGIAATAALWLVAHFIEKGSLADVGLPLDRRNFGNPRRLCRCWQRRFGELTSKYCAATCV